MSAAQARGFELTKSARTVKLVVWDLDDTIWSGTLAEGDAVRLRGEIPDILRSLDSRGILHSVASRNEHDHGMAKIREFGLAEYFLYPQINWNSKSDNIRRIAEAVNIGLDAICFVDDQSFEREEVLYSLPDVMTLDASEALDIPLRPEFMPRFITEDSARRRRMYQSDLERKALEETWTGPKDEFLASLNMIFTVSTAGESDLQRAEELTLRTNQLNSTGYTYSYEELDAYRRSPDHLLLIAELEDRFGTYGKIGLALIEKREPFWTLKLLLMSCRVMSRGAGSILLTYIMETARRNGARLRAEFKTTDRNRMMLVTYKFANFREVERDGSLRLLEHDLETIPPVPAYVTMRVRE